MPNLFPTSSLTTPRSAGLAVGELPAPRGNCAWMSQDVSLLAFGEAARIELAGPDRFERGQAWFDEVCASLEITGEVGRPGTGPICFGTFGFSDEDVSTLIVPSIVYGTDQDTSWVTRIGDGPQVAPLPVHEPTHITTRPGMTDGQFMSAVETVVAAMRSGRADKVVLSRELNITSDQPIDERAMLLRLAEAFDDTWIFCVDGFIGATPEMLASVRNSHVSTRVLAGSWPTTGGHAVAREKLAASPKDRAEHDFAVDSVLSALEDQATNISVIGPSIVSLPNVVHLSTDIEADLTGGTGLTTAGAMHPTAAVGGTPRSAALEIIEEIEQAPRGRYAAPVGWMDSLGNSDWGLALRCAQLDSSDPTLAVARAGSGMVVDSKPEIERDEVAAKFSAILSAFMD